jgi:hypothetical protein
MKYYDEKRMKGVREALEAKIMGWPGVANKEMMGCLCYFRGSKFFAFLVTQGLVVTKLQAADRARLASRPGAKPFEMSGRTASTWIQVPVRSPGDVADLLPFVRKSYEAASMPSG